MGKFEEINVFEQIGKLFGLWRKSAQKHKVGFCPQNREGHFVTGLQIPWRGLAKFLMVLAALYLILWLLDLGYGLLQSYLWGHWATLGAGFSVMLLLALFARLRLQYTLTDTELVIRRWKRRHYNLKDLKQWNLDSPPHIVPGRKIRLAGDGTEHITLSRLSTMEAGTHFVMLLTEATGLNLIEPFLGVETAKKPEKKPY